MKVRNSASIYFAVQGTGVIAWWLMMWIYPATIKYFQIEPLSQTSLLSFWLADLVLLGIGSLAAGWLIYTGNKMAAIAAWFVAGAVGYAALYTLAFVYTTDTGWLGVTLMIPAMIWTGVFAVGLSFEKTMFRKAAETSTGWILVKTFTQIIVVWAIILVILPYVITIVEDKLGIARFEFPFQKPAAAILFAAISSVGVFSAYIMAKIGKGTPLPLDHATKLVVRGPYSFVRNPMAVSGVGQGLAVALFLGSPLVAIYALMGSMIWQLIFRPLEEENLRQRFGAEYDDYCSATKCWIPRSTRYQIEGTFDSSNSIDSPLGRI